MEKIAKFQREALEANQKLQTEAMQRQTTFFQKVNLLRQHQLQKQLQEEQETLKKDVENEVEQLQQRIQEKIQLGHQMFEPDPKFSSTNLSDDQKLEFMRKGFLKVLLMCFG